MQQVNVALLGEASKQGGCMQAIQNACIVPAWMLFTNLYRLVEEVRHGDGMVHLPTFERGQNFLRELQLPSNDA